MPRGSNQVAVPRSTEGGPSIGAHIKSTETKRQRGRPKGAKNKAKSLIPTELAGAILLQMKDSLPPDHYEYIRSVVRDGKAISTKHEVEIMLLMVGRNLLPALLEEMKGEKKIRIDPEVAGELGIDIDGQDGESQPKITFRKDVTERFKAWVALANLNHQMEKKSSDEGADSRPKPIFEIYARRGIDSRRIRVLASYESGDLGGNPDLSGDTGGEPAIEVGTVSGELLERPLDLSHSKQIEAGRILPASVGGDNPLGNNEEKLQSEHRFDWGEGS